MAKKQVNTVTGEKAPSLKEQGSKISKDLISNGDYFESEILKEGSIFSSDSYQGLEGQYPDLKEGYFDPYEDYIDAGTLRGGQYSLGDLNKMRAENQSKWEQTGHAFARVGTNVVPQIIGGFASMLDIEGYFDAEEAANNSIVNWAQDLKKEVDEDWFPIYEDAPGQSMQMGDFAWWMSRGSGLVESIGSFLAQGAGTGKLVSMGLKGLGQVTKGKNLARAVLGGGTKGEKAVRGAERSKQLLGGTQGLTTAAMLNQSEAVIEATQVYKDTYDSIISKGGSSEEEARKQASIAASTTMNINRLNILLNITSAKAFLKPQSFTRQLIKNPSLKKSLALTALEGGQEAMEELVNHVASKAGMAAGQNKDYTFQNALDDMGTMEGFEAAFLGALGGIGQTGGTKLLQRSKYGPGSAKDEDGNRVSHVQDQRNKYEKQQKVIEQLKKDGVQVNESMMNTKDHLQFIDKLINAQTEEEANALVDGLFETQVFKAAQSGTMEVLEELYQEEANKDPEEVGQEHIDRAKMALKNMKQLEGVYTNHEDYVNPDELFYNKANEIRQLRNKQVIDNERINVDNEYSNLVKQIAKKYEVSRSKTDEVILKKEGVEVGKESKTTTEQVPLSYSLADIEANPETTDSNKATYAKFLKEVKQLPQYQKSKTYEEASETIDDKLVELNKEYKTLTSKEYQEKAKVKKEKEKQITESTLKLPDMTSISEIERLKKSINDEKFSKAADIRINEIKKAQQAEQEKKQKEAKVNVLSDKIKNAKLEDTKALEKEIKESEIPKSNIDSLLLDLDKRIRILNGEEIIEEGPIPGFSSGPEVSEDEASTIEGTIPEEIPNNNTEKEDVEKEVEDGIEELQNEEENDMEDTDEEGNLIYDYARSVVGHNRAAYLSRKFNQREAAGTISREDLDELEDNLQVLDPDTLLAGTPFTFKVKEDHEGDVYDSSSNTKGTITWAARKLQLQEQYGEGYRTSDEYLNEVPIVAIGEDGQEIFYLHDANWVNDENVAATTEELAEDRAKLIAMRQKVLENGNAGVKTTITYKGFGKLFKTASGEKITVAEAMPDTELILAVGRDGEFKMAGDPSIRLKGGKENTILNNEPQNGRLYALLPVGPNHNIAIALERQTLLEQSKQSILKAIELHLANDNTNSVVQAIANSDLGVDITTVEGLRKYLSQFVHLVATEGQEGLEGLLTRKTDTFNSSVPVITVTPTGIEFGRPGVNTGPNGKKAFTISQNFEKKNKKNNEVGLEKLAKLLTNMLSNANQETLELDSNVTLINEGGETNTLSYTELLKESYKTNIMSINIGDEQNPKYVYTIQPTILFDTGFADFSNLNIKKAKPPVKTSNAQLNKQNKEALNKAGVKFQTEMEKAGSIVEPNASNAEAIAKLEAARKAELSGASVNNALKINKEYDAKIAALKAQQTSEVEKQKADIEERRQEELENKIKELENKNKSLRSEDGSVSEENMAAWKQNRENIKQAKANATRGNLTKNQAIAIRKRTEDGARVLRGEEAINEENKIEALIQKILNGEKTIDEVMERIARSYGFLSNELSIIKNYISDRTTNAPEIGNNKQSFQAWRKGEYDAELAALEQPTQSTTEDVVGEEATIEQTAIELAELKDQTTEALQEQLNNMVLLPTTDELEYTIKVYNRAIEIRNERANDTKTIILPNGEKIVIDKNTKDDPEIGEGEFDESIPTYTPGQLEAQSKELDETIIRGINPRTQQSLIYNYASKIISAGLKAQAKTGKGTISTKPIFQKELNSLKVLKKFYAANGVPNKAKRVQLVIDQFAKVKVLTNRHLALLTTGNVSNAQLSTVQDEAGLVKSYYSDDWSFTVSSKGTASADLRKFFASVVNVNEDGDPLVNLLGLKEIVPFDVVYDTLHEKLTNQPADMKTLMKVLKNNVDSYPWIQSVITKLENAPVKIKNEFVSDMTKHNISMRFIMWSKDKHGNYSLQSWNSNNTAIEYRLQAIWNSNLRGAGTKSNLVTLNEDNEYIYDETTANGLIAQAKEFATAPDTATFNDLATWLGNFGIILTDQTYADLKKGKFKNGKRLSWNELFTHSSGLVNVLQKELQKRLDGKVKVDDNSILQDTVVKQLAKLDAKNTANVFSNSFNAGTKTIYSYGNNNFLVNRMRDLTAFNEDGTFKNQNLINDLNKLSFTKDSTWLAELTADGKLGDEMKEQFSAGYVSLEALKKEFTKSKDKRKLNNLSTAEHEITKINFFFNNTNDKTVINGQKRRRVSFFYPTMSDKSTMLTIQALSQQLKMSDGKVSQENIDALFDSVVLPEINRIYADTNRKVPHTVKGYEPSYFYFMHGLNETIEIDGEEVNIRDLVIDGKGYDKDVQAKIKTYLRNTLDTLVENKLNDWEKLGIGITNAEDKTRFSFLDKSYMASVAKGTAENKVRYAATDFVFNSLIANAEMYKLFAGDPALYAKFKSGKTIEENLDATFTNITKRLAGDIAPGIELANSADETYHQVFFADTEIDSNNLTDAVQKAYFEKIIPSYGKDYAKLEGSDAQEYTTWKEHLRVLDGLGRLTKKQYGDIYEALSNGRKLSYEQVGLVLQPLKPVYVGNEMNTDEDVDRRVYIKSSSFPLIPQLTETLEIDKVRVALEKYEQSISNGTSNGKQPTVRASFGTANKVGATSKSIKIFNKDGSVVDGLTINPESTLVLNRKNFRIQQDVPYKREKDAVNIGSQERKLLFVNLLDVQIEDGVTGKDLYNQYTQHYKNLFEDAQQKIAKQLGIVTAGDVQKVTEYSVPEEVTAGLKVRLSQELTDDATLLEKLNVSLEDINDMSFEDLGSQIKKICS